MHQSQWEKNPSQSSYLSPISIFLSTTAYKIYHQFDKVARLFNHELQILKEEKNQWGHSWAHLCESLHSPFCSTTLPSFNTLFSLSHTVHWKDTKISSGKLEGKANPLLQRGKFTEDDLGSYFFLISHASSPSFQRLFCHISYILLSLATEQNHRITKGGKDLQDHPVQNTQKTVSHCFQLFHRPPLRHFCTQLCNF